MFKKHALISVAALTILCSVLFFVRGRVNSQTLEIESTVQTDTHAPSGIYLNYQGQLLDSSDQLVNATLSITFRLYKTLSGGTACWSETHSGGNAVDVADGVFSVTLGKLMSIDDSCVTDDIYLELVVNGETLSPREQLTPFANTLPDNATTLGKINTGAITINTGAVPLTFVETGASGAGSLWRMPLHGKHLRIDVSQNGTDFEGYLTPFEIHDDGFVEMRDDVGIGGKLTMGDWINSPAGTDLTIDPGAGTLNTIQLLDNVYVQGNLTVGGTCTASQLGGNDLASNDDAECSGGSITTGAVIEANLQTQAEMRSEKIDRFELGDLLCWSEVQQQLALCSVEADPLIMAVADKNGKPIVMGAEPIKVLGPVNAGDYLIASNVPGYAIATDQPEFGIVIAQALESSNGETGIIKAMIRKM